MKSVVDYFKGQRLTSDERRVPPAVSEDQSEEQRLNHRGILVFLENKYINRETK